MDMINDPPVEIVDQSGDMAMINDPPVEIVDQSSNMDITNDPPVVIEDHSSDLDMLNNLPVEIVAHIFNQLSGKDLWNCLQINKYCRMIANDNRFWLSRCNYISVELEPEELIPSDGVSLCSAAKVWFAAQQRATSWRTGNFRDIPLPNLLLAYHRNTILLLHDPRVVFLYNLTREGELAYVNQIRIPESSNVLNRTLVSGDINFKFVSANSLEIVVVYSRVNNSITFEMALGIKHGKLVDISDNILGYLEFWKTSTAEFYFEPTILCRNSLLVILNGARLQMGPIFIVNLLNKVIIEIILPFQHTCAIPSKDHVYFGTTKRAVIFDTDGRITFESNNFMLIGNNDNFVAEICQGDLNIHKLSSKQLITQYVEMDIISYVLVPPSVDYVFLLSNDKPKLIAFDLTNGKKLWKKELEQYSDEDVLLRYLSGTVVICCLRPPDGIETRIFGAYDAKSGKECEVKDIEEFSYFVKKKKKGRIFLRCPLDD